ncbi:hypothetical protein VHP8226_01270 [Vibrio hippocampi]|uniref:Uncharacterized protein n=1 Tax=Vibrio hippocampi TaxID=654686 RepID=A0ABN8DGQ5_9VIBR|nr:hypothetical protein VHP8226_01270 [Vibrio hippocampi]
MLCVFYSRLAVTFPIEAPIEIGYTAAQQPATSYVNYGNAAQR